MIRVRRNTIRLLRNTLVGIALSIPVGVSIGLITAMADWPAWTAFTIAGALGWGIVSWAQDMGA